MSIRTLLVCAALVSLSACEEAFAPESSSSSTFVFDYTDLGAEPADAFVAEGEVPPDYAPGAATGDWAFAFRTGPAGERVVVTAARARSDGRFDTMTLQLPGGAQAGQALRFSEVCGTEPDCAQMHIDFGVERGTSVSRTACAVTSGDGRVQALTGRRVAGSFSGTATCVGVFNGQTLIQRGAFDVAVVVPSA